MTKLVRRVTSDQRLTQMAKRQVDNLLRQHIGGEPLREAWQELARQVNESRGLPN
jgi:hypothetical protein